MSGRSGRRLLDSLLRVFFFGKRFLLVSLLRVFVFGERSCWTHSLGCSSSGKSSCWIPSLRSSSSVKGSCCIQSSVDFVFGKRLLRHRQREKARINTNYKAQIRVKINHFPSLEQESIEKKKVCQKERSLCVRLFSIQRRPSACARPLTALSLLSSLLSPRLHKDDRSCWLQQLLGGSSEQRAASKSLNLSMCAQVRNREGRPQPEELVERHRPRIKEAEKATSESITHSSAIPSKLLRPRAVQDALDAWWPSTAPLCTCPQESCLARNQSLLVSSAPPRCLKTTPRSTSTAGSEPYAFKNSSL